MARKKSLKKTRSKKYRAPCKRTKYSCSKSGGTDSYMSRFDMKKKAQKDTMAHLKELEALNIKQREEQSKKKMADKIATNAAAAAAATATAADATPDAHQAWQALGGKSKKSKKCKGGKRKKCKGGKRKKTKRRSSKRGG